MNCLIISKINFVILYGKKVKKKDKTKYKNKLRIEKNFHCALSGIKLDIKELVAVK